MKAVRALLIEDNDGDVRIIKEVLAHTAGTLVELSQVYRLGDALSRLAKETFDVVLLDLSLPDSQGLHTFYQAYRAAGRTPILILTGLYDQALPFSSFYRAAQH